MIRCSAISTQSVGVPSTEKWRSPWLRTRSGRVRVSECAAPLWLVSGATTQTSSLSARAIRSRVLMPRALMPSSLLTRMRGALMVTLGRGHQALAPVQVGAQRLGHDHAAVLLLVVLEDRDQRPADGEAGAVEGVDEAGLLRVLGPAAGVHPAGLEVAAVRAARDLAIAALPGQPDLDVVGPARGEAGVARGQRHHPVGQPQPLQDRLGTADHPLVLGVGLLRRGDADQLDLGELVLPDHALGVLPGGTGLRAEAGREGRQPHRQLPPRRGSRRRRGWSSGTSAGRDQPVAGRGAEEVLLELGQLAGAEQRLGRGRARAPRPRV